MTPSTSASLSRCSLSSQYRRMRGFNVDNRLDSVPVESAGTDDLFPLSEHRCYLRSVPLYYTGYCLGCSQHMSIHGETARRKLQLYPSPNWLSVPSVISSLCTWGLRFNYPNGGGLWLWPSVVSRVSIGEVQLNEDSFRKDNMVGFLPSPSELLFNMRTTDIYTSEFHRFGLDHTIELGRISSVMRKTNDG